MTDRGPTRIVVLGGGFGGIYAVMELERLLGRDVRVVGGVFPPTAQHASRQGTVLARNIAAAVRGGRPRPFAFRTLGQLAAIGRRTGVANILGINFSGFIAWWLWRTIYLLKLPRFERKLRVALDWTLDLLFTKDLVQCPTTRARPAAAAREAALPPVRAAS